MTCWAKQKQPNLSLTQNCSFSLNDQLGKKIVLMSCMRKQSAWCPSSKGHFNWILNWAHWFRKQLIVRVVNCGLVCFQLSVSWLECLAKRESQDTERNSRETLPKEKNKSILVLNALNFKTTAWTCLLCGFPSSTGQIQTYIQRLTCHQLWTANTLVGVSMITLKQAGDLPQNKLHDLILYSRNVSLVRQACLKCAGDKSAAVFI